MKGFNVGHASKFRNASSCNSYHFLDGIYTSSTLNLPIFSLTIFVTNSTQVLATFENSKVDPFWSYNRFPL